MAEILLKRGLAASIPALAVGEPGFTTDTHQCYVGSGAGNVLIGPGTDTRSGVWRYSNNTTMADPGSGAFRLNAATFAATSQIALDILTDGSVDVSNFLKTLVSGDIIQFQDQSNSANWARYHLSGAPTNNTGWFLLPVTPDASAGSAVTNNTPCLVLFTATGGGGGGGAGTVTSISQGAGITITPNPLTTTGTVALTVPVVVANGGTGATTAPAALSNLGGQPLDGDLTSLAAASATGALYYRSAADTWSTVTIGAGLTFSGGTLAATGGVPTTRLVTTTNSLAGGGDLSADRTLSLVNDAATPGNSMVYGTNASGTRGWYAQANQAITLSGDVTGSGTTAIATAIPNTTVTYAKMQNVTSGVMLGRSTAGPGVMQEIAVGTGLLLSGGTLTATGAASGAPASGVIVLATGYAIVGNPASTTETMLQSYNMPGGTMPTNGQALRIRAAGTFAANTRTKTIRMYFGGMLLASLTGAMNNVSWEFDTVLLRTGATAQSSQSLVAWSNNTTAAVNAFPSENLANAVLIQVTGQGGTGAAANDMNCYLFTVELLAGGVGLSVTNTPTVNLSLGGAGNNLSANLVVPVTVASGGTGGTTAPAGLNNLLPAQAGNANKVLATDATNASWQDWSTLGSAVDLALADTFPVYHGGNARVTADRVLARPGLCDFRLGLVSGDPCADAAGAATLYLTNYNGNRLCTWDGTRWKVSSSGGLSLSLASLAAGTVYDVFVDGTLTLSVVAWAGTSARATPLTLQDGVLVQGTKLYLGTVYCFSAGTLSDTYGFRNVWNCYNRVRRRVLVYDGTGSWTYNTQAWRVAGGNAANYVQCTSGVSGQGSLALTAVMQYSSTVAGTAYTSIGEDSSSAESAELRTSNAVAASGQIQSGFAFLNKSIAVGAHTYYWLEYGTGSPTCTFYGGIAGGLTGTYVC